MRRGFLLGYYLIVKGYRLYQKLTNFGYTHGVSVEAGEFFVVDVNSKVGAQFAEICSYVTEHRPAVPVSEIQGGVEIPDTVMGEDGVPVNPLAVVSENPEEFAILVNGKLRRYSMPFVQGEFRTSYEDQAIAEERARCEKQDCGCAEGEPCADPAAVPADDTSKTSDDTSK